MTHQPNTRKRRNSTIGNSVVRGLRQVLAYERGELKGQVELYNVPPAVDVHKIREKIGLSQAEFANRFGFNRRSLQDWEQGRRIPDSAARAYLLVIASNPRAVTKALFRKAS